jgi:hypothetical protein
VKIDLYSFSRSTGVVSLDASDARISKWLWSIGVRPPRGSEPYKDVEEWLDTARAALMRVVRNARKSGAYGQYLAYEHTRDIIYLGNDELTSVYQLKYLANKAYEGRR